MGRLDWQLAEDRALRDAASAVLKEDISLLRSRLSPNELANSLGHRAEETGEEIAEKASRIFQQNKGPVLAGIIVSGVLAAFLVSKPARSAIAEKIRKIGKLQEPECSQARSPDEANVVD